MRRWSRWRPSRRAMRYPSPIELAISPDGSRLYVLCEGHRRSGGLRSSFGCDRCAAFAVGHVPKGMALSPDGKRLYVANSWSDTVSEIDTASLEVVRTLPAGFEPNAVIPDRAERFLFVANRISNDVSVVDLATGLETKRLLAGRGASYLALSPGRQPHLLHPHLSEDRHVPRAARIGDHGDRCRAADGRRPVPSAQRGGRFPHGAFGGWTARHGRADASQEPGPAGARGARLGDRQLAFRCSARTSAKCVQIPIDELDRYYTPPFAIALSPDKSAAYVSTTGSDSVTVIDVRQPAGVHPRG